MPGLQQAARAWRVALAGLPKTIAEPSTNGAAPTEP
jgi:hypothetical protein